MHKYRRGQTMVKLGSFLVQIFIWVLLFATRSRVNATRNYGSSVRRNAYNEILQEKIIRQSFMQKILAKLGMTKRPPPVPYDKRKPNIPRPVLDGGIASSLKEEDAEKKVQIVISSEEESKTNCQDKQGCYAFKLNHALLRRNRIQYATIHIYNEAAASQKNIREQKLITIETITNRRARRSAEGRVLSKDSELAPGLLSERESAEGAFDKGFHSRWLRVESEGDERETQRSTADDGRTMQETVLISSDDGSVEVQSETHTQSRTTSEFASEDLGVSATNKSGHHADTRRKPRDISDFTIKKGGREDEEFKRRAFVPQVGWFKINAEDIVTKWLTQKRGSAVLHRLRFSSNGLNVSTKPRYRPFIVLGVIEKKPLRKRKRRSYSANCKSGFSKCCLQTVYLNFRDINWHDWIIEPPGYQVSYCEGHCTAGILSGYSDNRPKKVKIKGCCIPLEFEDLLLLHYDEEGLIHKQEVPNMSVLECGCA